jgi:dimethylhistidine N-methyltransferase
MSVSPGRAVRTIDRGLVDVALSGLSRPQKTLPAKLFYDEEGCRLFYRITELPEYYLTRTERALLPEAARQTLALLQPGVVLVEYGASDEGKAAFLLNADAATGNSIRAYVPIDVASPALMRMSERLAHTLPNLAVHPVVADFMDLVALPSSVAAMPRLGFFPGSTIGNLDPEEARRFLTCARSTLGEGAYFLVGVDLRKDPSILVPAYDDAAGVTAAFNRNILVRLNREAGADFDPDGFAHRAVWNDAESRIEMHLVSRRPQTVSIAGNRVNFLRGETVHTENSYKYAPEVFQVLAANGGWQTAHVWTDPGRLFSLSLLKAVTST